MKKLFSSMKNVKFVYWMGISGAVFFIIAYGITFMNLDCWSDVETGARAAEASGGEVHSNHIIDLYSSEAGALRDSSPFFRSDDVAICWSSVRSAQGYFVDIATDSSFQNQMIRLYGKGDGPCRIPDNVLGEGGRYFYRIHLVNAEEEIEGSSEVKWFAWDPRFSGMRIQAPGYHPLGKSESPVTIRDRNGVLHLAIQQANSSGEGSNIVWMSSADDGKTWTDQGAVNLEEQKFSRGATIGVSPEGDTLYVAYLGNASVAMPYRVSVASCDLKQPEWRFSDHYIFEEIEGLAWRRPWMAVDAVGTLHLAWDGTSSLQPVDIMNRNVLYSNNLGGDWRKPVDLTQIQDSSVGSSVICVAGEIHVIWENGWRYSKDNGSSWIPALDQEPARPLPDWRESRNLRWRSIAPATIPGQNAIAMAIIGERREGLYQETNTVHFNEDELWIAYYTPLRGWTAPDLIHSLNDSMTENREIGLEQSVYFLERPSIAADRDGAVYVAWDETEGIGPAQQAWRRTAYICRIDAHRTIGSPVSLPKTGDLSGLKPLVSASPYKSGVDILWSVGLVPPYRFDPLRDLLEPPVMGLMAATEANLAPAPENPIRRQGVVQVERFEMELPKHIPLAKIKIPPIACSSDAPTNTATPWPTDPSTRTPSPSPTYPTYTPTQPSTPSPSPTPTPDGSIISMTPIADCFVRATDPDANFGANSLLFVSSDAVNGEISYLRFDLSGIPPNATILGATLTLYFSTFPATFAVLQCHEAIQEWTEAGVTFNNRPADDDFVTDIACNLNPAIIDVLSSVQDWVDGTKSNFGFSIGWRSGAGLMQRTFFSREVSSDSAPLLQVWYEPLLTTPTPTAGPPGLGVDMDLNQSVFREYDPFLLKFTGINGDAFLRRVQVWILLDVAGGYYFWPGWSDTPDFEIWDLQASTKKEETILDFIWPHVGALGMNVIVWGGLYHESTGDFAYDTAQFTWE